MVRIRWCLLIVPFVFGAMSAQATMVLPQNLEQLESGAERVFVGVCTSRTALIDERGIPVHEFTFRVVEGVKGRVRNGNPVVFRQFGSDVPNARGVALRIAGLPGYTVGQEVLVFLNRPGRLGLTAPVALSQGLFQVSRDANGKRRIVLDPIRRKTLVAGMDAAKYASNERFSAAERKFLISPPEQVEVAEFCSLIRKIVQERERKEQQSRGAAKPSAPDSR